MISGKGGDEQSMSIVTQATNMRRRVKTHEGCKERVSEGAVLNYSSDNAVKER